MHDIMDDAAKLAQTIMHGRSPGPHTTIGHGSYSDAVHDMDPTARLERLAASSPIWEVRSYDGEVYGIGGPRPDDAWEAAAHYLGADDLDAGE